MDVILYIPDDLARRIETNPAALQRRALEALAAAEFKSGHLSKADLRRLLGFPTRDALDGFLKSYQLFEPYTLDDLRQDRKDIESLG